MNCPETLWAVRSIIPYYLVQDGEVYPLKQLTERNEKLEKLVAERTLELSTAFSETKLLSRVLPICSGCKKIRDDKSYWTEVETYVTEHSEAQFTHGMCPACLRIYFPDYNGGSDGESQSQSLNQVCPPAFARP